MRRCLVSVFFFSLRPAVSLTPIGVVTHNATLKLSDYPHGHFFDKKKSFEKKSSRIEGLAQCDVA